MSKNNFNNENEFDFKFDIYVDTPIYPDFPVFGPESGSMDIPVFGRLR